MEGRIGQRQLYDVTHLGLKCGNCDTPITQLPFQPQQARPVYCRPCQKVRRVIRPDARSDDRAKSSDI